MGFDGLEFDGFTGGTAGGFALFTYKCEKKAETSENNCIMDRIKQNH